MQDRWLSSASRCDCPDKPPARHGHRPPASDTQNRKWRIADHRVGQITQAATRSGSRTSADDQRVRVKSPTSLKQPLFDRADHNMNRRLGSNSSLQISQTLFRLLSFLRLNLFLQIYLNGHIAIGGLDSVNNMEIRPCFGRRLMGIAEHSF